MVCVCVSSPAEPVPGGRECGDGEGEEPDQVRHDVIFLSSFPVCLTAFLKMCFVFLLFPAVLPIWSYFLFL